MPQIQPFRGVRYNLGQVGSLSDVVAPPYDVIDDALRDTLYKQHPANVIRLILGRDEPGDSESGCLPGGATSKSDPGCLPGGATSNSVPGCLPGGATSKSDESNRYTRAARLLKNWQQEGVLQTDPQPAVYVYHQTFETAGEKITRCGFMCRVRLERFGEGTIYPHEQTYASAKEDRLRLTRACRANLSPIFGLYPDADFTVQNGLESLIAWQQPLAATDHLGVVHHLWPVTEPGTIAFVRGELAERPMYVADGHHRYETACNYRDELETSEGPLPADHPAHYVLMMCVGMSDPGMIVLPTHRLFSCTSPIDSAEMIQRLGACFSARVAGEGSDLAESLWREISGAGNQGTIGLYAAKDDRWIVAKITDAGREKLKTLAPEQSDDWRGLGVSILHRLVVDELLGAAGHPRPEYVHQVSELIDGIDSGPFTLAALVMPATLDHVRAVSEHGERMPAKSTYFYPKLLSGLVINPLT